MLHLENSSSPAHVAINDDTAQFEIYTLIYRWQRPASVRQCVSDYFLLLAKSRFRRVYQIPLEPVNQCGWLLSTELASKQSISCLCQQCCRLAAKKRGTLCSDSSVDSGTMCHAVVDMVNENAMRQQVAMREPRPIPHSILTYT